MLYSLFYSFASWDFIALALILAFDLFILEGIILNKPRKIFTWLLISVLLLLILISYSYIHFIVNIHSLSVTITCEAHLFKQIYLLLLAQILLIIQLLLAIFGLITRNIYCTSLALTPLVLILLIWLSLNFTNLGSSLCTGFSTP